MQYTLSPKLTVSYTSIRKMLITVDTVQCKLNICICSYRDMFATDKHRLWAELPVVI